MQKFPYKDFEAKIYNWFANYSEFEISKFIFRILQASITVDNEWTYKYF